MLSTTPPRPRGSGRPPCRPKGKTPTLLYRDGTPRLAPLYDVVPVLVDAHVTHDFAFSLGQATNIDALTLDEMHLVDEAIGIPGRGSRAFERRSRDFAQAIFSAIAVEIDSFQGPRLKVLGEMIAHQLNLLDIVHAIDSPLWCWSVCSRLNCGGYRLMRKSLPPGYA